MAKKARKIARRSRSTPTLRRKVNKSVKFSSSKAKARSNVRDAVSEKRVKSKSPNLRRSSRTKSSVEDRKYLKTNKRGSASKSSASRTEVSANSRKYCTTPERRSKRIATDTKSQDKNSNREVKSGSSKNRKRKFRRAASVPKFPKKLRRTAVRRSPRKASRRSSTSVSRDKGKKKTSVRTLDEWEVEKIVDVRCRNGEEEFKVKWKGFSKVDNSWEPRENLGNAEVAIEDFYSRHAFEVEFICGSRSVGGKKEYNVKWKGWPASANTWEPRASLMKGASGEVSRFEKMRKRRVA